MGNRGRLIAPGGGLRDELAAVAEDEPAAVESLAEMAAQYGLRLCSARHFFLYFTQARVGGVCVWEYGNMRNGNTFGGDAQYRSVGPGTLGAFAGPVRSNPNC
jgi:hypothetical protein